MEPGRFQQGQNLSKWETSAGAAIPPTPLPRPRPPVSLSWTKPAMCTRPSDGEILDQACDDTMAILERLDFEAADFPVERSHGDMRSSSLY